MSDLFRSALGYLSGSQGDRGNDFVGQTVELGDEKLRVKRVIAEGKLKILDHRLVLKLDDKDCLIIDCCVFLGDIMQRFTKHNLLR